MLFAIDLQKEFDTLVDLHEAAKRYRTPVVGAALHDEAWPVRVVAGWDQVRECATVRLEQLDNKGNVVCASEDVDLDEVADATELLAHLALLTYDDTLHPPHYRVLTDEGANEEATSLMAETLGYVRPSALAGESGLTVFATPAWCRLLETSSLGPDLATELVVAILRDAGVYETTLAGLINMEGRGCLLSTDGDELFLGRWLIDGEESDYYAYKVW